jgi:hypothetical protein
VEDIAREIVRRLGLAGDEVPSSLKRQFREAWAALRAGLTDADIAWAFEMRRD